MVTLKTLYAETFRNLSRKRVGVISYDINPKPSTLLVIGNVCWVVEELMTPKH